MGRDPKRPNVFAGRYYGVTAGGRFVPLEQPAAPDFVMCRRVADFPADRLPTGFALGACGACAALIVYNPAGPYQDRPRRCMQCAGVRPLPFESEP